jgi:acyl CoA:acetate/3-ketoacid CoA transferase
MAISHTQTTGQANVGSLNSAIQQTHIHIDLTKTFYSITPSELQIIEEGSSSIWKDVTLAGLGIGIPCCVNSVIEYQKVTQFNSEIFWNGLIGGVCVVVAIIFAIIWFNSKNPCINLINEIKQRPKYNV